MAKPQIFNRDMKRLAYLDNALAVGYGLETNSLWTATFTLPADDPKNAYCTPLNFVEIFDGDEPHICRGCYAQAWSVGEVLRAYTEDILPHLK